MYSGAPGGNRLEFGILWLQFSVLLELQEQGCSAL